MSPPNRPWSPDDDALLTTWYARETTEAVAARLHRSTGSVYKAAKRLGLYKPRIGARAGNVEPLGTIRKHGRQGYLFIKVAEGRPWRRCWRRLHYVKWEAVHGPVPDTHVLTFKDGNVENVDPANLELVRKADWIARYNPENTLSPALARVVRLKAALTRRINHTIEKEKHERQQQRD